MSDDVTQSGRSAHIPGYSGHDDNEWMTMFSALDDDEVDALLAGTPTADDELAPVAEVAQALRRSAAAEPVPPMGAALRAQLDAPPVILLDTRRATRRALAVAGAAAAAVAVVGLGVGATQNRLPAGLQDVVSSTAGLVGIDVPRADDRHVDTVDGDDQGDDTDDTDGTAPAGAPEGTGTGNGAGNGGEPGYEGTTPGGATPADPGTPGDHEPATPATPPPNSNGGQGSENRTDGGGDPETSSTTGKGPKGQSGGGATSNGTGSAQRDG